MSARIQCQAKGATAAVPLVTPMCSALLQRKTSNSELGTRNDSSVPPIVHEVLRSPGQPLDAETRAFMELRFGHDFSQVRVRTDDRAAESAQTVNVMGR